MAYAIDDIYTDRQGNKYKCTTAGTPPTGTPFNPNNVVNEEVMWGTVAFEKQESGSGGSNYLQRVVNNASANQVEQITVSKNLDYNRSPIEVLKQQSGQSNVSVTPNTFVSSESSDFTYDTDKIVFDGSAYMKTEYSLTMSTPTSLGSNYICESSYIDPSEFITIEEVTIE